MKGCVRMDNWKGENATVQNEIRQEEQNQLERWNACLRRWIKRGEGRREMMEEKAKIGCWKEDAGKGNEERKRREKVKERVVEAGCWERTEDKEMIKKDKKKQVAGGRMLEEDWTE